MTPHYFTPRTIDDRKALLERSYRLRYQVYCLERKFLPEKDYPDGLEIDRFDRHAIHIGAIDVHGDLAGTARVVRPSEIGLPIFEHCAIHPQHRPSFNAANPRLVEVGRLSVSRTYRRRRSDDPLQRAADDAFIGRDRRRQHEDVFLTLLKGMYQASKLAGATNWLAATEKPLQRMLAQHGFPFHQIGPDSDYFGVVAAYQMDLQEFEDVVVSGRYPGLEDFFEGLNSPKPVAAGDGDELLHAIGATAKTAAPVGAV